MKKSTFAELTNEKLLKRRDLFKGALIGFSIVWAFAFGIIIYLLMTKDVKNLSVASLFPLFTVPLVLAPTLISLNLINKEIKSRNL